MTDSDTPESRQIRGTPAYLAPEVLKGQPQSLQSEVYSLGVLLYYLATSTFPDRTASQEELRSRLSTGAMLSPALSSLIGRCLAPNPEDRFQAMPEVADALTPMTTTRTRRFVRTLRTHAWLWLVPMFLAFAGAALWSARTPYMYRSSARLSVEPPAVPASIVQVERIDISAQLPAIRNRMLSRTRLERIILDLGLYSAERETGIMEDAVERMRSDVGLSIEGEALDVSFTAADPRTAQRVAERLTALLIDETQRSRQVRIENTDQFLEATLEALKRQIVEAEENLGRALKASAPGTNQATAETLELEVAKEQYRKLLTQRQESQLGASLERRQIGEQFTLLDPARVPTAPIGPSRWLVMLVATLSGLAVGLILVALRSASAKPAMPAVATPVE
jgi:uncharacterized protein involved in exopolysaccharide biosynthesis